MSKSMPTPISLQERRSRLRRIRRVAKDLGFKGETEYRHVVSGSGGAQYGMGLTEDEDLLVVFAEAFDRDANPDDFSLEAILAHERGHQLLTRHPSLLAYTTREMNLTSEEILASLIGSLIAVTEQDRQSLYYKAFYEAVVHGMDSTHAAQILHDLRVLLENVL